MSGELVRVAFHFPNDIEIRYLADPPRLGQGVAGRAGERFVVSRVESDGDGYLASCLGRYQYAHEVRRRSMELRQAALRAETVAVALTRQAVEMQRPRRH